MAGRFCRSPATPLAHSLLSMRHSIGTIVMTAALLAVAGCGGGGESETDPAPETASDPIASTATEAAEPTYPACDDVWQVGLALPSDYEGCLSGDTLVADVAFDCKDGSKLRSYQDQFWVVGDGKIAKAEDTGSDPAYATAYSACV